MCEVRAQQVSPVALVAIGVIWLAVLAWSLLRVGSREAVAPPKAPDPYRWCGEPPKATPEQRYSSEELGRIAARNLDGRHPIG